MSKRKPYIGVAGFMTSNEIMAAISTLPVLSQRSTHVLAIGILTSAKTLRGETNKYPNRYPKIDEIENILRPVRDVISANVIPVEIIAHYAVESSETMGKELIALSELVQKHQFDGIQINISPHLIGDSRLAFALGRMHDPSLYGSSSLRVIVQVRPTNETEPYIDLVGAALWCLEIEQVTDLLLDASAGQGVELNPFWASGMIHAIRSQFSMYRRYRTGFGVAGGLRPGKLASVYGLLSTHGPLSFDAESGVRDKQDNMHIPTLLAYLQEAWSLAGPSEFVG